MPGMKKYVTKFSALSEKNMWLEIIVCKIHSDKKFITHCQSDCQSNNHAYIPFPKVNKISLLKS